jgi:hypothetical protein
MNKLETQVVTMTPAYETMKQQRVLWGCSLVVGFILIYYAGAPVIPVIAGCVLVPAMSALRSRFRLRK